MAKDTVIKSSVKAKEEASGLLCLGALGFRQGLIRRLRKLLRGGLLGRFAASSEGLAASWLAPVDATAP